MEKTVEPQEQKSRRDVLKALGAAAAGTVAGSMLSTKEAQAGHGTLNASASPGAPAIHATSSVPEPAVLAENTGAGGATALTANSASGIAILGDTNGTTNIAIGVLGRARASSGPGIGVLGRSSSDNGTGVFAAGATALHVDGPAKFSTAGAGTIAAGQDSAVVSNTTVTSLSHITVTLTGDPGQAASQPGFKPVVVWVERQPGTGFVVHLSRPVRVDTPFTYLIVEPA